MARYLVAEEGPLKGLIIDLEAGQEWLVGKDPEQCDYILEDETIADLQVRIERKEEGIYVENLDSSNPIQVNHKTITEPTLLEDGDSVTIGENILLFVQEERETTNQYDTIFEDVEEEPLIDSGNDENEEETLSGDKEEKIPFEKTVYDTIFEDSKEYEELPFHLLGDSPMILKVITGPNAGAEIGLQKDRTYTIGKDSNSCDIVFQDVSVSRAHAKLIIQPSGEMTIEDLESKNGTLINGIEIDKPTSITGQDLVQLGTTTFLIIDREALAETIYAPSEEREEEEEEEETEEELEEVAEKVAWKNRIIPMRQLVLAGSALFILFVVFLSFFSLFKSERAQIAHKEENDQIKEVMELFPAVNYTYNPASGKLFLSGHVITAIDLEKLQYEIEMLPFVTSTDSNVIIDEMIAKTTNDVLAENAGFKGISIVVTTPGKFTVSGYLQNAQKEENLSDFLTSNFPYLDRLDNQVVNEEELNQHIGSMLLEKGFPAVSYKITNGELLLTGRYNVKKERFYDDLLDKFSYIKGIRSVRNFALPSSLSAASIDLSKKYSVTGYAMADSKNYSVIINGKIFVLGQSMDGMKITDIEKDTILLEKDGINYKIQYSR